jgi:2-dehydropantoate 2-reductase
MKKHPKIIVVGAGAIGGTTAAMLTRNQFDVTLVCKYPELAARISNEGISIHGMGKTLRTAVPSVATAGEVKGPVDLVLLATKATDMENAARDILPLLHAESKVVAMQNGILEPELQKIVGPERTVGCVVGFGATMIDYGEIKLTSHGEMWLGYPEEPADDPLKEIGGIMNHVARTHTVDGILPIRYAKLIINSCTSTLGVISGMELGPMLKRRKARQLFVLVGKEALRVADAMELEVPAYDGIIRFHTILNAPSPVRHLAIRILGIRYRKLKSTNLQSLERGGRTEIEYLNHYIVKQGELVKVPTPVNRKLVEMVREIENKQRDITPGNLYEVGSPD